MTAPLPPDAEMVRRAVALYRASESCAAWVSSWEQTQRAAEQQRLNYDAIVLMYQHLEHSARVSPFSPPFHIPYI